MKQKEKQKTKKGLCVETLKLLGDFWTLRIIDALKDGSMRYCAIQRAVGNVNPATLTKRLHTLEARGIISRAEEPGEVLYSLTGLGKRSLPVIEALDTFSHSLQKAHS